MTDFARCSFPHHRLRDARTVCSDRTESAHGSSGQERIPPPRCSDALAQSRRRLRAGVAIGLLPLLLSPPESASGQGALTNPSFEQGPADSIPRGWWAPDNAYRIFLVTDDAAHGKRAARIEMQGRASTDEFGNLMQMLDASPYRGKRIRLRAWVRVEPGGARSWAGLWLRVDRPNRQISFFENMQDRPIRSGTWAEYEVVGAVADDAERIALGLLLAGSGNAWLDGVRLDVVGDAEGSRRDGHRLRAGRWSRSR